MFSIHSRVTSATRRKLPRILKTGKWNRHPIRLAGAPCASTALSYFSVGAVWECGAEIKKGQRWELRGSDPTLPR